MSKRRRRITLADIEGEAPKVAKFRSRWVTCFGHRFQSKHEAEIYMERRQWLRAGRIRDLKLQKRIPIVIGGVPVRYENGRQMVYKADFAYIETATGRTVIEDAKSEITRRKEAYRIKKQLLGAMGVEISEV